jgi:hypothetical protein
MKRRRFLPYLQAKLALALLWSFAGVCAGLPFYVHFHPEQFGPPRMAFTGALETVPEDVEIARSANALLAPRLQLDRIVTGSIEAPLQQKRPRASGASRQPFPDDADRPQTSVQFISISPNRALALVDGRMVILYPGDRLGDGRVLAGFERAGGVLLPKLVEGGSQEGASTDLQR